MDEAARDVRANRQALEKANEKPFLDARKKLQQRSTALVKDGKTTEATAILKQVETLEADVIRMANATAVVRESGANKKSLLERLSGKWRDAEGGEMSFLDIRPNGTLAQITDVETGQEGLKTRLRLVTPDTAEAIWPSGVRWQLRPASDDLVAVLIFDSTGKYKGNVLERIK